MKAFSWFGSWVFDYWALWKDFCFDEFQTNSMLLLNLEHSILTDVKTNQNRFEGSGQDIWRIQIPKVEPFVGFSVPCELRHFRFSGCFLVVACRPLFFGISEYLSEDLGSYCRLPHLEVFTLEPHIFFLFFTIWLFHHTL